jgi:hypothetical protein
MQQHFSQKTYPGLHIGSSYLKRCHAFIIHQQKNTVMPHAGCPPFLEVQSCLF